MATKVSGGSRFQAMRFSARMPFDLPVFAAAGYITEESGASQSRSRWSEAGDALPMSAMAVMYPVTSYLGGGPEDARSTISASHSKPASNGRPLSFDTRKRAARRPTSSLSTRTVVIGIGSSSMISISS